MSILKFKAGRRGAGGKNAGYITRESACDSISFHNLDELEGENQYENRVNALSYAHNREEEEMFLSARGRTHYRMILSWEGKEETMRAKEMTHEFLKENFKDSRAVVAVHQDTEHTHAHVWIDARNLDDRKLHSPKNHLNELCRNWQEQYDREYGTDRAQEFSEKREETRLYKLAMHSGFEQPKPERAGMTAENYREKDLRDAGVKINEVKIDSAKINQIEIIEEKNSGVITDGSEINGVKSDEFEQSGFGGNQRRFETRDSKALQAERAVAGSERQLEGGKRDAEKAAHSVDDSQRTIERTQHEFGKLRQAAAALDRAKQLEKEPNQERGFEQGYER